MKKTLGWLIILVMLFPIMGSAALAEEEGVGQRPETLYIGYAQTGATIRTEMSREAEGLGGYRQGDAVEITGFEPEWLSVVKENSDGSCVCYDPDARCCRIQTVKPKQCRDFPTVWNFPGWERLCAGARTEHAEYPVYRGPVKLMAALVLVFGSVPFLNEIKLLPLVRGTLSAGTFLEWWKAWLENGTGAALLIFPVLTLLTMLYLVLGKLTRRRRYRLWLTGLLTLLISALFLWKNFTATLQFEALLLALGGAALWLSRPKPEDQA